MNWLISLITEMFNGNQNRRVWQLEQHSKIYFPYLKPLLYNLCSMPRSTVQLNYTTAITIKSCTWSSIMLIWVIHNKVPFTLTGSNVFKQNITITLLPSTCLPTRQHSVIAYSCIVFFTLFRRDQDLSNQAIFSHSDKIS